MFPVFREVLVRLSCCWGRIGLWFFGFLDLFLGRRESSTNIFLTDDVEFCVDG